MLAKRFEWDRPKKGFSGFRIEDEKLIANERYYFYNRTTYRPLQKFTGLFRRFSEIDITPDGILAFANEFGLLEKRREPLSQWSGNIRILRDLVDLWDEISSGNCAAPEDRLTYQDDVIFCETYSQGIRDDVLPGTGFDVSLMPLAVGRIDEYRNSDAFTLVLSALLHRVNFQLRETTAPMMALDRDSGKPELSIAPLSLIGAIWLQFAWAIHGSRTFKQCRLCNEWFEVSPDTARTSKTFCSDRCRFKSYRQRIKKAQTMAAEGITPAEIAVKLDSTEKTVLGWIEKGTTNA